MTYATLKYELSEGIATVTINRPEKNNAISMEMRGDFRALSSRGREGLPGEAAASVRRSLSV